MLKTELRKNIISIYFIIAVILLYLMFMMGDSGRVLANDTSTTIFSAIYNKFMGNWQRCSESSFLVRLYSLWTDNDYLPVLMPFLCGLPAVFHYLEEEQTTNTRFILVRASKWKYVLGKLTAGIITAVLVGIIAISVYAVTLILTFDNIAITEDEFSIVYLRFSGEIPKSVNDISMGLIYMELLKQFAYFTIYCAASNSFCMLLAIFFKEKYTTMGSSILLCYLQCRINSELVHKYINEGKESLGIFADILDPVYLHYAGESGFYEDKEWLALLVAGVTILINCFLYIRIWSKRTELGSI